MAAIDSTTPPADPAAGPNSGQLEACATGAQFRLMVERVRDYAIFMMDPQGEVLTWNSGARRIKGYRPAEIIGRHFSVFYSKEDRKSGLPERELAAARSAGRVEHEGWRLRKDGSRFWASVTITALYDESGELTGFGKVTRDLTGRRRLEEALLRSRVLFEQLFENAPDAVVVVDHHGKIRKVNQQAEALFGYLREEILGQRVELLMPERLRKGHLRQRRSYFKDPRLRTMGSGLELLGRSRDGREIPLDIMLTPMGSGEGAWAFAVIRDITRQRVDDAKIGELTAALRDQIERLTATSRELEAFSYAISDDLRAPLRQVGGLVDLLNERDLSALDQKSRHYLQVVTQAAGKMGSLIDDLLAFNRVGRGELVRSGVDLDRMAREIAQRLSEGARGREIEWVIAPLPAVEGDAELLGMALEQLLANAVKFTRPRARARIEVGSREAAGETQLYVSDNGVGFDIRYVSKLFGLFQRLHGAEEFEGTGVGLAKVQRIVLRHGGRVWAEGAVEGGATIWFSLPKTAGGGSGGDDGGT